jgi:hypothetical protein
MFSDRRELVRCRSAQWPMVARATFAMFVGISSIFPAPKARWMEPSEVTAKPLHTRRD